MSGRPRCGCRHKATPRTFRRHGSATAGGELIGAVGSAGHRHGGAPRARCVPRATPGGRSQAPCKCRHAEDPVPSGGGGCLADLRAPAGGPAPMRERASRWRAQPPGFSLALATQDVKCCEWTCGLRFRLRREHVPPAAKRMSDPPTPARPRAPIPARAGYGRNGLDFTTPPARSRAWCPADTAASAPPAYVGALDGIAGAAALHSSTAKRDHCLRDIRTHPTTARDPQTAPDIPNTHTSPDRLRPASDSGSSAVQIAIPKPPSGVLHVAFAQYVETVKVGG